MQQQQQQQPGAAVSLQLPQAPQAPPPHPRPLPRRESAALPTGEALVGKVVWAKASWLPTGARWPAVVTALRGPTAQVRFCWKASLGVMSRSSLGVFAADDPLPSVATDQQESMGRAMEEARARMAGTWVEEEEEAGEAQSEEVQPEGVHGSCSSSGSRSQVTEPAVPAVKLRSRRDERVEPLGWAERSVSASAIFDPSAIYKSRRPPPSSRATRRRLSRIASGARWPSAASAAPGRAPGGIGGAATPQYGELFTVGNVVAASHAIEQLVAEACLVRWPCSGSGRHRAIAAAVFAAKRQLSEPLGPNEFAKIACAP